MAFLIVRNDITKVQADALVNTANPKPTYASGTDRAIYEAAGIDVLLAARKQIGRIARGDIAVTPAFALHAKYIIHTVGPVWNDGRSGELNVLASCYQKSLDKAAELGCESIAFPLIATGVYGFPKDKALQIAINAISSFLMSHEMTVILVVFDRASFELSGKVFDDVAVLIDDVEVCKQHGFEYRTPYPGCEHVLWRTETPRCSAGEISPSAEAVSSLSCIPGREADLETLFAQNAETFQQCLFRMIDERGLKDSEVYTKANIDRKHFSKIRCNPDYHPKKKTAVALAIAMELSMEETVELLSKAEWALSSSSKFDMIVSHYIQNRNYDIIRVINPALFKYNQPTLGA